MRELPIPGCAAYPWLTFSEIHIEMDDKIRFTISGDLNPDNHESYIISRKEKGKKKRRKKNQVGRTSTCQKLT